MAYGVVVILGSTSPSLPVVVHTLCGIVRERLSIFQIVWYSTVDDFPDSQVQHHAVPHVHILLTTMPILSTPHKMSTYRDNSKKGGARGVWRVAVCVRA